MNGRIRGFFDLIEDAWAEVPSYVEVFAYSSVSSIFGLYIVGDLSWNAVMVIVMTNLGLYAGPRQVNKLMR